MLTPSPTPGVYWLKGADLPLLRSLWDTLPEQEDDGGQPTLAVKENDGKCILTLGPKGCGGSGKGNPSDNQATTQNLRRSVRMMEKKKAASPTDSATEKSGSDTTSRKLVSELEGVTLTNPKTNTEEKKEVSPVDSPSLNKLQLRTSP